MLSLVVVLVRLLVLLWLDFVDVVVGGTFLQVHICIGHLLECGVDHILTVDTGHANLRNGVVEGDVRAGHSGRGCKTGQCVRLVYTVCRQQHYLDIYFSVVVGGEKGTECPVYKAGSKDFVVTCFAFTLRETTGETACSAVLLTIIYLQRHKICTRNGILGCTNSCEQYGVAHSQDSGTISLFCNLSGLNRDGSSIWQLNCFRNYVHLKN